MKVHSIAVCTEACKTQPAWCVVEATERVKSCWHCTTCGEHWVDFPHRVGDLDRACLGKVSSIASARVAGQTATAGAMDRAVPMVSPADARAQRDGTARILAFPFHRQALDSLSPARRVAVPGSGDGNASRK